MRILVIPGSNLVAMEILNSLVTIKGVHLYGAGFDTQNQLCQRYEDYFFLNSLTSSSNREVEELVTKCQANYVMFTHDEWILHFANLKMIHEARIVKSTSKSIYLSSYKADTYSQFDSSIPIPTQFQNIRDVNEFPVHIKPNRGQGSKGSKTIFNFEELRNYSDEKSGNIDPNWVLTEFLPGAEFTVDCFSNFNHKVVYAAERERVQTSSGISTHTRQKVAESEILFWAELISKEAAMVGAWFFQMKLDKYDCRKLLEISTRIGGASGINRLRGINLSLLNLYLHQGHFESVELYEQFNLAEIRNRSIVDLGFDFQEIIVDFDDTLIINGVLNHRLLNFLLNQSDKEKKVSILTRNSSINQLELFRYGINLPLFEIRIVPDEDKKSDHINTSSNFIFIDDSHRERIDVKKVFGGNVLVLDPNFCFH